MADEGPQFEIYCLEFLPHLLLQWGRSEHKKTTTWLEVTVSKLSNIGILAWSVFSFTASAQTYVSDYVENEYASGIGLGIAVYVLSIFLLILLGKSLGRLFSYTGLGSVEKSFGLLFGFFKGYIIWVCLFSLLNWFYPHKNWPIETEGTYSFEIIYKGSNFLVYEFPNSKDYYDETEDKLEKI